MRLKGVFLILCSFLLNINTIKGQERDVSATGVLIRGVVIDASTMKALPNAQVFINNLFSSVTADDGTFSFRVNHHDSVVFRILGYKSSTLHVSDTLKTKEYIAGIYMKSDTTSIDEVVIFPKYVNLKSEILNAPSKIPGTFENARYNVAISAYQGRNSQGKLGNAADNYALLAQRQKTEAFERGGIPSDKILGLSPLLLIPAAYLLIKGLPEKPMPLRDHLSNNEIDQINRKYLEMIKQKK